jgi:hypothetical protein
LEGVWRERGAGSGAKRERGGEGRGKREYIMGEGRRKGGRKGGSTGRAELWIGSKNGGWGKDDNRLPVETKHYIFIYYLHIYILQTITQADSDFPLLPSPVEGIETF